MCALVTGVQTCALPIFPQAGGERNAPYRNHAFRSVTQALEAGHMAADSPPDFRLRLRRDGNAVIAWLRDMWTRRWFRWLGYLVLAGLLGIALIWAIFARDMPSVDQLRDHAPQLPKMVRAGQGKPVHTYSRDRRVQ